MTDELRTPEGRDHGPLPAPGGDTGLAAVHPGPGATDGQGVPRAVARPAIPSGRCDYDRLNLIKGRCRLDGGHWIWTGATNKPGPVIWAPDYTAGRWKVQPGRRAVEHVATGRPLQAGISVWGTCGEPLCIARGHSMTGTAAERQQWFARNGRWKRDGIRLAAARVAGIKRRCLTPEQAADVQASNETHVAAAARLGVSKATIWKYRTGRRATVMGMFTGLMVGAAS